MVHTLHITGELGKDQEETGPVHVDINNGLILMSHTCEPFGQPVSYTNSGQTIGKMATGKEGIYSKDGTK